MRADRELGHKLGPRLVDLMVKATLAARKGIAPLEGRILQTALQALIDRAGHEVADLHAPLIQPLIDHEQTPEHIREILRQVASGNHQWQALAGLRLLTGTSTAALSTVISNAIAPAVYDLVRLSPNLDLDPQTAAQAAAAGIVGYGEAERTAREQGFGAGEFQTLYRLSESPPDPQMLVQLVNRGLMSEGDAEAWLRRMGYDASVRSRILRLREVLLSPADAALGVLRGNVSEADGVRIAAHNGVSRADFDTIVNNTGEPLGLVQLQEAYRRGFINKDRLERGIRQSRVRNEWIPVAEQLRFSPMATADAIDALLKGHIDEARAKKLTEQNGLEPSDFQAMYESAGEPLGLMQLLEAYRRGFINKDRLAKGIRQGRLRNEWIPVAEQLRYAPMATADAIEALIKGHIDEARAKRITEQNGLDPADFKALSLTAGEPLSLTELLEAYRRGFIDKARMAEGIRQGRLRNEWIPVAEQLRFSPMSTADAIEASIQNHITKGHAKEITSKNGLDPADFQALWDTAGEPLSRTEMEQLYNRGLVTAGQVKQALRESRLKDKYVDDALKLHVRMPEARLIVEMITHGAITRKRGITLLREIGYSAEVSAELIAYGEIASTVKHKELALSQVLALYEDKVITESRAMSMLGKLKYSAESAQFLIRLADMKFQQRLINQAIDVVRAAYMAHRLGDEEVSFELDALDIPPEARDQYLRYWGIERMAHTRTLTEAQVVKAYNKSMFDPQDADANRAEACMRLGNLGYDETDAALLLDGA